MAKDVFKLKVTPRKLTDEEVNELPVVLKWKGPNIEFCTDMYEGLKLLIRIIYDMNEMQNPKFTSAPLGNSFIF